MFGERLLVITNIFPNADGSYYHGMFVKGLVDALKDHFDSIYVVSPWPYGHELSLRGYTYDNVHVYYPRFFHLPFGYFRSRLGESYLKATLKVINREGIKFDIIHAHFTWPAGYAAVKLSKRVDVPAVVTIHENRDWFLSEYYSGNKGIYWTWENAAALIRVNKVDVPLLRRYNRNIYSIPNGFDPDRLPLIPRKDARRILGLSADIKMLFSLGNLIERKGFHYLLDAMSIVVEKRNDVRCFIGGDGPMKGKLQEKIKRLDLGDFVKLLGPVPESELKYWMNAADLFVLSSLSEGNPTVMFEALGVGLPFVGTAVGGVPEVITSEDYGLLCPPKDPECLAKKILTALEKEWDREKIKDYSMNFAWSTIAKRVLDVYKKVNAGL